MNRREFLSSAVACAVAKSCLGASVAPRIDRSRISAISDEIATTPAAAIQFAHQYGLQWLELRYLPGTKRNYWALEEPELKAAAREFKAAGIRISFFNTDLLKFSLPYTEPVHKTPEPPGAREKRIQGDQARFDRRMTDLHLAIRACHALDVALMRVFTFARTDRPESLFPKIARILDEMADVAEKEGVKLLIENEASQNAGTCAEMGRLLRMTPRSVIAANWDSLNSSALGEKAFPDGYEALPKERILNLQIKGKTVLDYPERLDWIAIFRKLERDGYTGQLGLETHVGTDSERVGLSNASMKEILRLVETP
jgi:sugar phosphate isomerase/epimerase